MPQYQELFAKGSHVRVKARAVLESFKKEWRYHNPITDAQIALAGKERKVASIGDYHGGDILYWLEGTPGVWHEQCIESAAIPPSLEKEPHQPPEPTLTIRPFRSC